MEEPQQVPIMVAIPNRGILRTELVTWLLHTGIRPYMPMLSPTDYARNDITAKFLQTGCKWLLMIDSGVVPPLNVFNMINNDVPICSAAVKTHKGKDGNIPVGMRRSEEGDGYCHHFEDSNPVDAPHKVDVVGTGCILIRRDVFENMEPPYWRFEYDENGMLTDAEDFGFCNRAGVDVFYDPRFVCQHYTTVAI